MQLIDHLFIVLLFLIQPVYGWFAFRRVVADAQVGEPVDRLRLYRETAAIEWIALAALLGSWWLLSRDVAALGLVAPGGSGFWWSLLATSLVIAVMLYSARGIRSISEEQRQRYVGQFGDIGLFLPVTRSELRGFYGLSFTAGVVEEVVFRGFVLWYLTAFMPMWAAVLLSSVAFGLGHSYQGPQGIWRTAAVGAALAVLFIACGSIWLPIIAHILFDMIQGAQAHEILRGRDAGSLKPA